MYMPGKPLSFILFLLSLNLTLSCTSEFKGEFPREAPMPVINAIITADSTISVTLSWTRRPNSMEAFVPITGAEILLWENNTLLDLPQETEEGVYLFNHSAKAGCIYRIEVSKSGMKTVSATTIVPENMEASVILEENPLGEWDKNHFKLTLGGPTDSMRGLWIVTTLNNNNGTSVEQASGLFCNSVLPDVFNRTYDSSVPDGYVYEYEFFIRIDAQSLNTTSQVLFFKPWTMSSQIDVFIITASEDYDKYFKTAWEQKSWDPEVDLPFSYQPIFIYSNITNGYGIFAGCNIQRFRFY